MVVAAKEIGRRKRRSSSLPDLLQPGKISSGVKVITQEISDLEKIEEDEIPVKIEKLKYATNLIKEQDNPSDYFKNTTEYQLFAYNSLEWNKYFEGFVNQKNALVDRLLYLQLLKAILEIRKEEYQIED